MIEVPKDTILAMRKEFATHNCKLLTSKRNGNQYLKVEVKGIKDKLFGGYGGYGRNTTNTMEIANKIFEKYKIDDVNMTSGGWLDSTYRIGRNATPPKTLKDKINIDKWDPQQNKFGQTPEVGDYIIGNRPGEGGELFVAEVLGWNHQSLIVKPILGLSKYQNDQEAISMRWEENMVIPKDAFGEEFESFLVMFKLSMEM